MLTLAMLNMKCMSFLMMMFIEVAVGAEQKYAVLYVAV